MGICVDCAGVTVDHRSKRCRPCTANARRTSYWPEEVLIDPADRLRLSGHRWYIDRGYAKRQMTFEERAFYGKRGFVYLHRAIMDAPNGMAVDHISGDRLDNRRANLRVVTSGENNQNRTRQRSDNKSGHRGVSWSNKEQKWIAQARVGDNYLRKGFETPEEAAAYASAWRQRFMPYSEADKVS